MNKIRIFLNILLIISSPLWLPVIFIIAIINDNEAKEDFFKKGTKFILDGLLD
jgi:hypothetical protein